MATKAVVGRALRETGAALKHHTGLEVFTRHRPKMAFLNHRPFQTNDTFIAPTASVIGNVTNWDESSVWYNAVVRADSGFPITIGFLSNVQEGAVVTTLSSPKDAIDSDPLKNVGHSNATGDGVVVAGGEVGKVLETGFPPITHIGHYSSIGSGSVLVSCRIDDLVDVGDKCTILEGAWVESNVILEPGSLVPPYTRIPSGGRWGGNPIKFLGDLGDGAKEGIKKKAEGRGVMAKEHTVEFLPVGSTYLHLEELEKEGKTAIQG
mmetsp:Transcript_28239/g.51456  ORF Transcript_28239/g.51456 Transcript_28239/m.51456 type:complete len:264 (-) Transcript_28239:409-1200(-)